MSPPRYRRTDRVAALILREVTRLVREEVHDPRIGFVTFTGAQVAPDLATGRLFVSVMGSESEKADSLVGLRSAAPFIRNRLWELLDLKTVPELTFELDRTLERAARIDAILERIQEAGGAGAGPDDAEAPTSQPADEAPERVDRARD
jgi:ribosome-binding factor A